MTKIPDRAAALELFLRYNQSDNLLRHALAVEAVMRYLAEKYGEDQEKWGVIGLIHDLDYEQFPEQHCRKTQEILEAEDWPVDYIRAVVAHGWGLCTEVEPLELVEKCLYAIDELTGLVAAAALVRPSRSVLDLTVKSVRKKWKSPAFAAGVDRAVIENGAARLGVETSALIEDTIMGMRRVAAAIGLEGSPEK